MIDQQFIILLIIFHLENKMRKELKPNLEFAGKIFPKVYELVEKASFFLHKDYLKKTMDDNNFGDMYKNLKKYITKRLEYKTFTKIENRLSTITAKDMSQYHSFKFWLGAGETKAFILSVPDPKIINDISKEELTEIVTKIWRRGFLEKDDIKYSIEKYGYYLIHYYKKLLEINFGSNSSNIIEKYDWRFSRSINENIIDIVKELWGMK